MNKCVICGNMEYQELFGVLDYKIQKCKKCGLVRTSGKQTVGYGKYHRDKDYETHEKMFRNIFQKRFKIISRFKKRPGRILDIGAATGTLLQVFADKGWETWGVEPSGSSKLIKERGFKLVKTEFEKAKLPKNYFDVVVLNHTLEHLKNPVSVVKKIRTILKKGGIVYVDVPNFGSLSSIIYKKRWIYLLPQEHVHHFTPETLKEVFKVAGLNVVWWKTWSGLFDVSDVPSRFLNQLTSFRPHMYRHFARDVVTLPGTLLSTALNKGTSLAMIGEKR